MSSLNTFLWFHATKFARCDSSRISHRQITGSNSQFHTRQISDKCKQSINAWCQNQSVGLLSMGLFNINTENLMHLDLMSIRLLNKASSLWVCTRQPNKNKLRSPSLYINLVSTRQRDLWCAPWTANCCEPSSYTRSMNTQSKKLTDESCSWELSVQLVILALPPYWSWPLG